MKCFLRMGSDYLEDAEPHPSITSAKYEFAKVARELDRYGQKIEAAIHIAPSMDEVVEYPDFVLSLGRMGGLKCERVFA